MLVIGGGVAHNINELLGHGVGVSAVGGSAGDIVPAFLTSKHSHGEARGAERGEDVGL